jgi:hypothetical protein
MLQTDFEIQRAILYESPFPQPFTIQRYLLLDEALSTAQIASNTHVLVAPVGESAIVLPTLEMIYYHVAQGEFQGRNWVASFCALCNAGGVFDATIEGKTHHFAAQGLYDAMTLIADQETQSFWNHLTGICLHGPLEGLRLPNLGTLLQMVAGAALVAFPQAQIAVLDPLSEKTRAWTEKTNIAYRLAPEYELPDAYRPSVGPLDGRLPRYDMGLGIWTATTQRYYPMTTLHQRQNALIDQVDGRSVIIVFDADVGLPMAFYLEAAQLEFRGNELILGAETIYHKGLLHHKGQPMPLERPNQSAIRWYGFSSLFPNCEIYGQPRP